MQVNGVEFFCVLDDYLVVPLVAEMGDAVIPSIIVDESVSSFSSISFCCIYFEILLAGAYTVRVVLSSWWVDPFIIMSCPVPPYL